MQFSSVKSSLVWFTSIWLSSVWFGFLWLGLPPLDLFQFCSVWSGSLCSGWGWLVLARQKCCCYRSFWEELGKTDADCVWRVCCQSWAAFRKCVWVWRTFEYGGAVGCLQSFSGDSFVLLKERQGGTLLRGPVSLFCCYCGDEEVSDSLMHHKEEMLLNSWEMLLKDGVFHPILLQSHIGVRTEDIPKMRICPLIVLLQKKEQMCSAQC